MSKQPQAETASADQLKKEIDKLRAPMPELVSREGLARILGISTAMVDHLTNIGVFSKSRNPVPVAVPVPAIISTRDAMRLIGMTDRNIFYRRVRLGFYRSFGNNAFHPAIIVADHAAYLKSGLAEGDYRSHAAK